MTNSNPQQGQGRPFNVDYGLSNPNDPNKHKIGTFVIHWDATYQYQVVEGKVGLVKVRRFQPLVTLSSFVPTNNLFRRLRRR